MFTLLKYGIPYVLIGLFVFPPQGENAVSKTSAHSELERVTSVLLWPERAYEGLKKYM